MGPATRRVCNQPPSPDELPFLKRYAFKDEGEYPAIYEGAKTRHATKDFSLQLSFIAKISISP